MSEKLKAARTRLTPPEAWTRGTYAQDALGNKVSFSSTEAKCWCLVGAMFRDDVSIDSTVKLMSVIRERTGHDSISDFNDDPNTTHADVLDVLDKTIEGLEA